MLHRRTLFAIIASVLVLLVFCPNREGSALLLARAEIRMAGLDEPGPNAEVHFRLTRYSIAATTISELQLRRTDAGDGSYRLHTADDNANRKIIAEAVLFPERRDCIVYASAQTFDKNLGAYGALRSAIPNGRDRWLYILLHEHAHCVWNATLSMENHLAERRIPLSSVDGARMMNLARHFGEAYADASALMRIGVADESWIAHYGSALADWRYLTSPVGATHRTAVAVLATRDFAANRGGTDKSGLLTVHQTAAQIAATDLYYWLLEAGTEAAVARADADLIRRLCEGSRSTARGTKSKVTTA